jgi:hypothetical protein
VEAVAGDLERVRAPGCARAAHRRRRIHSGPLGLRRN